MKPSDVQKLELGLYRIWWRSGGSSLASVGQLYNGKMWLAPTNWTHVDASGIASSHHWGQVRRVVRICEVPFRSSEPVKPDVKGT